MPLGDSTTVPSTYNDLLGKIPAKARLETYKFYPEDYGAVKDGVHNDLAALQACVDACDQTGGGSIILGKGVYNLGAGTLKVGNVNVQHHINIIGVNPLVTQIISTVTGTDPAIYLNKEKYVYIQGFYLVQVGSIGNGVGIIMGGDGSGTQTNGSIVEEIIVDGFNVGIGTSGSPGIGTSSEITFINLQLNRCNTGFNNASFNGLDYTFIQLQMANNGIGINMATSGLNVFGGSSSNNGDDFIIGNSGENQIRGFRSEVVVNTFATIHSTTLTISDCLIQGMANSNTHTAILFTGGQLIIENSYIGGQIIWTSGGSVNNMNSLLLRNNAIVDGLNTYSFTSAPDNMGPGFRLQPPSGGGKFESINNNQFTNTGSAEIAVAMWPSGLGLITAGNSGQPICMLLGSGKGAQVLIPPTNGVIFPTAYIQHIGQNNVLKTITVPQAFPATSIQLIPDVPFAYDNTGNIAGSGTAVVNRVMTATWDPGAAKWFMSY